MDYQQYLALFDEIINEQKTEPPYNQPDYLEYTRLNYSRMNRWWKTLQLNEALVSELKQMKQYQKWIILTEPWCGDAAASVPFLVQLAEQSANVEYELQLRDKEPFLINSYLTNGTKSIPKLIVRDESGNDLFTWGPRPKISQQLVNDLKASNADFDTLKTALQNWYNKDKGSELQRELQQLFKSSALAHGQLKAE